MFLLDAVLDATAEAPADGSFEFGRSLQSKGSKQQNADLSPIQRIRRYKNGKSAKKAVSAVIRHISKEVEIVGDDDMDFLLLNFGSMDTNPLDFGSMNTNPLDFGSMNTNPLDFSSMNTNPLPNEPLVRTVPPATSPTSSGPQEDDEFMMTVEYLAQCAGASLDHETCLVSTTLDAFMSIYGDDDGFSSRRRFLQASNESSDCAPPPMQMLQNIIEVSKQQCTSMGITVSNEELESTVNEFTKIFSANQCWRSLCEDQTNWPTFSPGPLDDDVFRMIIEYVTQCAGASLDHETCLVSTTLDVLMGMNADGFPSSRRFLQASNESSGCAPPPMQELQNIIEVSKQQCASMGITVSNEELESTVNEFTKIFSADQCWRSLCEDAPKIMFQMLFTAVATCAQVDFDVEQCILDHAFDLIFYSEGPDTMFENGGARVRRALQEVMGGSNTTNSCSQPTEEDFSLYVTFLLSEAEATCMSSNVTIGADELNNARSDLINIFLAQDCWGDSGCDNAVPTFMPTSMLIPTDSTNLDTASLMSTTQVQCDEVGSDVLSEKTIELPYYYRVEAREDDFFLKSIEQTLLAFVAEGICGNANNRRLQQAYSVVSVDSSPIDTKSTTCESTLILHQFFSL